jgi:hypothetical protein
MCRKQLTIGVLVSFCTFVAHATAQRNELAGAQKNELSGLVGRQFISDQIIPTSTSSDNLLRFGNGLLRRKHRPSRDGWRTIGGVAGSPGGV